MAERDFGFTEIAHTADWALKVWAPDLQLLFVQAAAGMYWLMETELQSEPRVERVVEVYGIDAESLLVNYLSELLYLSDSDGLGFDRFEVDLQETRLRAVVWGAPITGRKKEIKAVTYHNLAVRHDGEVYRITIVFDV